MEAQYEEQCTRLLAQQRKMDSLMAQAKLSDTEFGGSDSARDRAKSFANFGKPPVA